MANEIENKPATQGLTAEVTTHGFAEADNLVEETENNLLEITSPHWLIYESSENILLLIENLGDAVYNLSEELVDRTNAWSNATLYGRRHLSEQAYDILSDAITPQNLRKEKTADILLLLKFLGDAVYTIAEEIRKRTKKDLIKQL